MNTSNSRAKSGKTVKMSIETGGKMVKAVPLKSYSLTSNRSCESQSSIASVGIGVPIKPQSEDAIIRFRLIPEGTGTNELNTYDQLLFDCVIYVIFCEKHQTIALTNITDRNRAFSWFPFFPLNEVFTWHRTSQGGLAIILGQDDSSGEMEPSLATVPEYTIAWLNLQRIQMPNSRFYARVTQFVKLLTTPPSSSPCKIKCCQPTNRIRWIKLDDIVARKVDKIWGDEVVTICQDLRQDKRKFLYEWTLDNCHPPPESEHGRLLQTVEFTNQCSLQLYEAFARHLYPAWFMTEDSFRCFMLKHKLLSNSDKNINRLFKAFANGNDAISFQSFLIGMACMHPKANKQFEARAKFVYHYYDLNNRGILTDSQMSLMVNELGGDRSNETITKLRGYKCASNIRLEQFCKLFREKDIFPLGERVLRLEKSFFDIKKKRSLNT